MSAIINHGLWMRKEDYREQTILGAVKDLKTLARSADLFSPEDVKEAISRKNVSEGQKEKLVNTYARFAESNGIAFVNPRYRRADRLPHVPLEHDIDQLIGAMGMRTATFLQLLKETGMRPGEAWSLRWTDVHGENDTVTVNSPEKGSHARVIRVSPGLISTINRLPRKTCYVFRVTEENQLKIFSRYFFERRRRAVERLGNPRLLAINFKALKHFKATREYHKTKDILHVKQLLGHKRIENTLIYTHLIDFKEEEYAVRVAESLGESVKLLEAGFEYVTDYEGKKLFRKRK